MMDASYSDNVHEDGSGTSSSPGSQGMQPFETGYRDDEEDGGVAGAQFHDDEFTGEAGVFRSEDDAATPAPRRTTKYCHPYNKYILLGAAVFFALSLAAGISVKNNEDAENAAKNSDAPTPSPVSASPTSPSTIPPTQTKAGFLPLLGITYPPSEPDDSLPEYVHPANNFGHLVAMDGYGLSVVVAMKSAPEDPDNYYGAFYFYRLLEFSSNWTLAATMYDQLSEPPTKAQHHQSMSLAEDGHRFAFTQGEQIAIWLTAARDPDDFEHLGNNIADFGPDDDTSGSWYAVALALSPLSELLGVIVTREDDGSGTEHTTSMLEIYHYKEVHHGNGDIEDTWTRVAQLPLSSRALHGSISFDFSDRTVAVGTFDGSVESVACYVLATNEITSWAPFGDPMTAAQGLLDPGQDMGGSVVAISGDGSSMMIGSIDGVANVVILLRWNSETSGWDGYGTNNVLRGESEFSSFGASVQFNKEGNRIFVGAPGSPNNPDAAIGKIFIYQYFEIEDEWRQYADPIESNMPGDSMGSTLAVNEYGNRVVAGLPHRPNPQSSTEGAFQYFGFEE